MSSPSLILEAPKSPSRNTSAEPPRSFNRSVRDAAALAIQMRAFDELAASGDIFNTLRAYALGNPVELYAQQANQGLVLNVDEILFRPLPTVGKLIFEVNFAHYADSQQSLKREPSEQLSFSA